MTRKHVALFHFPALQVRVFGTLLKGENYGFREAKISSNKSVNRPLFISLSEKS